MNMGEKQSYYFKGTIPPFTPVYKLNVTPHHPDLEKRFTYLRAEYINPVSAVSVNFDPHTMIMTFYIKFPFLNMPLGVGGYSMPLSSASRRRRQRKD
ncbi:uncharacterized protein LOC131847749 [Achroia grisella]|uniref:uncharacterized protein LOC131847749 n=1 Tax=Achroia grisella TaxID=688607 RepID=UPI0027D2C255|nr:uncharacterized protein LOC131847749 [Achroia grisella]